MIITKKYNISFLFGYFDMGGIEKSKAKRR